MSSTVDPKAELLADCFYKLVNRFEQIVMKLRIVDPDPLGL